MTTDTAFDIPERLLALAAMLYRDQLETCKCDPFNRCAACHEAHLALTGRRLSGVGHQRLA
jgi:hypothetical protein